MRLLATAIPVLFIALTSLALDNNNPEKWISPNKKYLVKEAFYGEGKRVVAVFVNLTTSRSTVIKGGGARNSSALWSPDSYYVALSFERSHNWEDAAIYRVERGRISEVKLPSGMEPVRFLPSPSEDQILHVGPQAIRALRWLDNKRIELISETAGSGFYRKDPPADAVSVDVEQHFIVELSGTTARIIKSYARKEPNQAMRRAASPPAIYLLCVAIHPMVASHVASGSRSLILFSLGPAMMDNARWDRQRRS